MIKKLIFASLIIIYGMVSYAQDTSFDKDVQHFIELNGTMTQFRGAADELVVMLKKQYENANVPAEVWEESSTVAHNSIDGLKADLSIVYQKYFTHKEIKELISLYDNKTTQKFINNVIQITDASQDASIVWSRSLYNQLTDFLYQKGYTQ